MLLIYKIAFISDPNYADELGCTALHRAAANGEIGCMKILKECGSLHKPNAQGNFPCHWAALNGQAAAVKFLIENYDIDMLAKNIAGRSILTEAFQSQNTEVIEHCLSHSSATEEKLMKTDDVDLTDKVTIEGEFDDNTKHSITHSMDFTPNLYNSTLSLSASATTEPVINGSDHSASSRRVIQVRELPITRADNPFGSDIAPEDDTTGIVKGKDHFSTKYLLEYIYKSSPCMLNYHFR